MVCVSQRYIVLNMFIWSQTPHQLVLQLCHVYGPEAPCWLRQAQD